MMVKSGAGEMMCSENEVEGQQLMMKVLSKKGILMMLQQRKVVLELLHH